MALNLAWLAAVGGCDADVRKGRVEPVCFSAVECAAQVAPCQEVACVAGQCVVQASTDATLCDLDACAVGATCSTGLCELLEPRVYSRNFVGPGQANVDAATAVPGGLVLVGRRSEPADAQKGGGWASAHGMVLLVDDRTGATLREDYFDVPVDAQSRSTVAYGCADAGHGRVHLVGTSSRSDELAHDAWFGLWALDGHMVWTGSLRERHHTMLVSVAAHPSGGAVAVGHGGNKGYFKTAGKDAWIIDYSPTGVVHWSRQLGGPGFDAFMDVLVLADGCSVAVGYSENAHQRVDGWIVRWTADGRVAWDLRQVRPGVGFEGSGIRFSDVVPDGDGGIVAAGVNRLVDSKAGQAIRVTRIDPDGQVLWVRDVPQAAAQSVVAFAHRPGGYLVAGLVGANGLGPPESYTEVTYLDGAGHKVGERKLGGGAIVSTGIIGSTWGDHLFNAVPLPDGRTALAGTRCPKAPGAGDCDGWLVVTDAFGNADCASSGPCHVLGDCSDREACTADWCGAATGCTHSPVADGQECPGGTCVAGQCTAK